MKKECKASIAPPSLASGDATPCCVRENLPNTAARSSLSLFPRARKKECGISPAVHTAIRSNRRFCCIFPPTTPPKSRLRSHAVAAWQDRRIAQKRNKQPNGKRFLACSSVAPVTVRPSVCPHSSALQQKQPVVVAWCSLSHRSLRQWQPNPLTAPHTALPTPRVIG
jgi:hypothetical protein